MVTGRPLDQLPPHPPRWRSPGQEGGRPCRGTGAARNRSTCCRWSRSLARPGRTTCSRSVASDWLDPPSPHHAVEKKNSHTATTTAAATSHHGQPSTSWAATPGPNQLDRHRPPASPGGAKRREAPGAAHPPAPPADPPRRAPRAAGPKPVAHALGPPRAGNLDVPSAASQAAGDLGDPPWPPYQPSSPPLVVGCYSRGASSWHAPLVCPS